MGINAGLHSGRLVSREVLWLWQQGTKALEHRHAILSCDDTIFDDNASVGLEKTFSFNKAHGVSIHFVVGSK